MLKKIVASTLVLATVAGASLATTGTAEAYYWHRGYGYGGWHGGYGGAVAGGLAAGLLGGALLGGAIAANNNRYYYDEGPVYYGGPAYYAAPPAYYGCRMALRRVPNQYNGGWHTERVRVCY